MTTSSWAMVVKAEIGGIRDSLATLGVKPDATPGYDSVYDVPHPPVIGTYLEAYFPHTGGNWPPIWGSKYAFDFTSPLEPRWMFNVETNHAPGTLTLSWDTAGIGALPPDYPIVMKDSATGVLIDMRNHNTYSFQYDGPRSFVVRSDPGVTVYHLAAGWNLVSLPRVPPDSSAAGLFPNSLSPPFSYEGGYVLQSTIERNKGYWIKFRDPRTFGVPGLGIPSLDIPVTIGWNLIGSVEADIPAPSGGLIISRLFGYDGGYQPVDTLRPGRGYWVKTVGDGSVHLGPAAGITGKSSASLPRQRATVIDIRDREYGRQRLTLAPAGPESGRNALDELPPIPAGEAFDARFASGRSREFYGAGRPERFSVLIQSASYPVVIAVTPADPGARMTLTEPLSGRALGSAGTGYPLRVTITDPGVGRVSITVAPGKNLPSACSLEQNYPNPFNPVSTIGYSVAARSDVRLTLTDVLGREIAILDEGIREAGPHTVTIDAGALGLSSGMYLYRLRSSETATGKLFTAIMKLAYLK